jgi:GDP-L-fucose synthase
LAAWTQAGDFCLRHPGEQWLYNQAINTTVLNWWADYQPNALMVCIGTSCSYDPTLPLAEEHYLAGTPIDGLYTYAMTKRMLLVGLQALNRQRGMRYLYAVPSTLYGPHYHTDGRQLHFIFDLIRKILKGKYEGAPVELWGDGEQKRELIHVADFVDALLSIRHRASNTLVNIGAGEEHSIRQFAEAICAIVGFDPSQIRYDRSRYVGARSKVLRIDRLKGYLPHFQPRPLTQGLQETIEWCLSSFLLR